MNQAVSKTNSNWLQFWGRSVFHLADTLQSELLDSDWYEEGAARCPAGSGWINQPFSSVVESSGIAGPWVDSCFPLWQYYMIWNTTEVLKEIGTLARTVAEFEEPGPDELASILLAQRNTLGDLERFTKQRSRLTPLTPTLLMLSEHLPALRQVQLMYGFSDIITATRQSFRYSDFENRLSLLRP